MSYMSVNCHFTKSSNCCKGCCIVTGRMPFWPLRTNSSFSVLCFGGDPFTQYLGLGLVMMLMIIPFLAPRQYRRQWLRVLILVSLIFLWKRLRFHFTVRDQIAWMCGSHVIPAMCKSSSLIFVLLFAFLFRLELFSWRLVAVIFLIFSGVLLMVATETDFFLEGFLLVITASVMGGLRWSLLQIMLRNKQMGCDNPAATIYWLAPAMGVCLAIVSAAIESWSSLFQSQFFSGLSKIFETVVFLGIPGVVAFCMVLSEF